ncbi:ribonuclease T2-like [Aspergillus nanangensis]|uniref:ribonuclease T2 n=1 Tax=Aspergillus nanangensis TaxID=2582783 RepID=A0AAD4CJ83_ASPNN|nr:ribonuclease T2-like [Aspergillus nanangensis]
MPRTVSSASSLSSMALVALGAASGVWADLQSCPTDVPFSCNNSTSVSDTCCFNSPGGALLLTQFWDTDPATGPTDSWTLHGLWPDNCDGSYEQFCDSSREYSNITAILQEQGRDDLLSYMKTYWPDWEGDDETFWEHEWNKHGTCISTIEPSCYTDYTAQQEVGDYLAKAVDLFKGLDTYKALADAGITPDESKTYDLSDIESALAKLNGGSKPSVSCDDGALNQAWYFFNVKGNLIDGEYKPTDPLSDSNCPKSGVKYLSKPGGSNSTASSWKFNRSRAAKLVRSI